MSVTTTTHGETSSTGSFPQHGVRVAVVVWIASSTRTGGRRTCISTELQTISVTLTMTLIWPASKWMHWATLRLPSDLFWAATSASSQVITVLNKSLLTVLLQFVRRRPGPLLNSGTSQCNVCGGMRWWSIRITCRSQWSLLSLNMSCCSVLTLASSFVRGNAQDAPLPSVMSSLQSFRYAVRDLHLHCTEGLIGLLLRTTSSSPLP